MSTPEQFNQESIGHLPAHLGITITDIANGTVTAEMPVQQHLMATNGFLHAGSVITLADTCSGVGCLANLPKGAVSFTTIELKSNHLGTARDGTVICTAKGFHLGRTTQVWDAEVRHKESGKVMALFRCTQLLIYPR